MSELWKMRPRGVTAVFWPHATMTSPLKFRVPIFRVLLSNNEKVFGHGWALVEKVLFPASEKRIWTFEFAYSACMISLKNEKNGRHVWVFLVRYPRLSLKFFSPFWYTSVRGTHVFTEAPYLSEKGEKSFFRKVHVIFLTSHWKQDTAVNKNQSQSQV